MGTDAPINTDRALNNAIYGLYTLGLTISLLSLLFLVPAIFATRTDERYILLAMGTIVLTPGVIALFAGFFLKRRQVWAGKAARFVVGAALGFAGTVLLLFLMGLPDTWAVVLVALVSLVALAVIYHWLYLGLHALRRHLPLPGPYPVRLVEGVVGADVPGRRRQDEVGAALAGAASLTPLSP